MAISKEFITKNPPTRYELIIGAGQAWFVSEQAGALSDEERKKTRKLLALGSAQEGIGFGKELSAIDPKSIGSYHSQR